MGTEHGRDIIAHCPAISSAELCGDMLISFLSCPCYCKHKMKFLDKSSIAVAVLLTVLGLGTVVDGGNIFM